MREPGSKARLREFLRSNVGRVIDSHELREAAGTGVSEWARRVRELRENEHWPILTHHDRADLKPGEYLMTEAPPQDDVRFTPVISSKLRAQVHDRNGFTCQMCGLCPGDIDPQTGRKVRLHIGHIVDKSLGGRDVLSNLRTLCSTRNRGAKNITAEKPTAVWLLSQVRWAGHDEQAEVLK